MAGKSLPWLSLGLPVAALACVMATGVQAQEKKNCKTDTPVSSVFPIPCTDGSTGGVDMDAGAAYVWKAFIALNWPAKDGARGVPDTTKPFGAAGTRVWETLRSKVELYPGNALPLVPPHGVVLTNGKPSNGPDYGYSDPPKYLYSPLKTTTVDGSIKACQGQQPVTTPAWHTLDETTQIGNNQTFAGVLPKVDPSGRNSQPQLIRYGVKMNQDLYANIVEGQYWYKTGLGKTPLQVARDNYTSTLAKGQANDPPSPFVNFASTVDDSAAVELKMSWRPLTGAEAASGRFYQANVRYYELASGSSTPCWREDTWGLVGMHLITFTREAPWGIWSTFEQADNILTADGKPVEDADGNVINPPSGPNPTSPQLSSNPEVVNPVVKATGDYCTSPGARLFFRENPSYKTMPSQGNICANSRWHAIPQDIVALNAQAHQSIQAALKASGQTTSPWLYYKLINVQATPVDYSGKDNARFSSTASYYLANSTIETDYSLGMFTGDLVNGVPQNVTSSGAKYNNTQLLPFQAGRIGFLEQPMAMGGCAGCHGYAASVGQDFSFALGDNPAEPQQPSPFKTPQGLGSVTNFFSPKTYKQ